MVGRGKRRFTAKQGQYLTFIKVSPPSVHQMVLTLHARGLITREPGRPRSIRLLLGRGELPDLE